MSRVFPPIIPGEDMVSGAQVIDGSLKFDVNKTQYLNRTFSAGNRKTWTWSGWIKKSSFGTSKRGLFGYDSTNDHIRLQNNDDGGDSIRIIAPSVFDYILSRKDRDTGWFHLVVACDTTDSTAGDRVKIYHNGVRQTNFYSSSNPGPSADTGFNQAAAHSLGRGGTGGDTSYADASLSNVYWIDGQALDASYFGYTDPLTNTWRPKKLDITETPGGSWGTNGFYLPFDGSAPIGQDQSGQGNNWTPVNFGGSAALDKATGALPILNTDGGGKVARVGVRTDENASSLVLALPLVGIKSDFSNAINSGTTEKVVTATNAVGVSTQSNFYGGSYYFNGSTALLSIPDNADFNFGSGDFTIECWVRTETQSGSSEIIGQRPSGSPDSFSIWRGGAGYYLYVGSGWAIVSGASLGDATLNTWVHLAVVRDGNDFRCYCNGQLKSTTTSSSSLPDSTAQLSIGANVNTNYHQGEIQDVRIYKGVAKYTSNFIPASTNPDILPDTPSGVSGGSKLTKVIDGAVAFDGTGDYLSLANSTDFALGAPSNNDNDFTVECFFLSPDTQESTNDCLFDARTSNSAIPWMMGRGARGRLRVYDGSNEYYSDGGTYASGSGSLTNGWNHVAWVRSGTTNYLFENGRLGYSFTSSTDLGTSATPLRVGVLADNSSEPFNGFISNARIIKGTALYTSNFTPPTEPLTDVTNTKLLCCKSNSSATAFDVSPGTITANGNASATNFNPFTTNINAVRGQESGYATLNPLDKGSNVTLSDGNLKATVTSPHHLAAGTIMVSSEKYYAEFVYSTLENGTSGLVGVCNPLASRTSYLGGSSGGVGYNPAGNKWVDGSNTAGLPTSAVGDVIGIALNKDVNEVSFYKNNVLLFTQTGLNASQPYTFAMGHNNSSGTFNFGQKPFKFPPPEGFLPLNAANARPSTVIARPDQYVGIVTYTGNSSSQSIINNFSPDLVWLKSRTSAFSHYLGDTVRGKTKLLQSNSTAAEITTTTAITSFDSNGFTLGPGSETNLNNDDMVAWTWKAGGGSGAGGEFWKNDVQYASASAAGLTAGTITPTGASVNTKSGFSIITYTGNTETDATVSHGLNEVPGMILIKGRDNTYEMQVYHQSLGPTKRMVLNTNTADVDVPWNNTAPTSSVFTVRSGYASVNANTLRFVAYCWAEIPGFSKFGSYIGTGVSPNYVHLGFRPALIIIKNAGTNGSPVTTNNWLIQDSKRNTYNQINDTLYPNLTAVEANSSSNFGIDFLNNGFALRTTGGYATNSNNASEGHTFIYAAWAEAPTFNLYGAQSNAR